MELKELGSDELLPVAELNRAIWYPHTEADHYLDFYRTTLATPWSQAHVRVMGLSQGTSLLCSFKLYTLDYRIGTKTYRTAGIGALMTFPEHRHKGYATHMLKAALTALRASYQISMLFAEINPLFFARLGFVHIPTLLHEYDTTRSAASLAAMPPLPEGLIRPALEIDLEDVLPIYADTAPACPLGCVRDIWFWRHRMELGRLHERLLGMPRDTYHLIVYGEPGNVNAYMWLSCRPQKWEVEEIAGRSGTSLEHLLEWTLREARAHKVPRVTCQVKGHARAAWGNPHGTTQSEPAFMIHPLASSLDPDALDRTECNLVWKTDRF